MGILCIFFPHKWIHIFNIFSSGVWQCTRCKTIPIGKSENSTLISHQFHFNKEK